MLSSFSILFCWFRVMVLVLVRIFVLSVVGV